MKIAGIFESAEVKEDEKFFLRLVPASSYEGAVSVEAVDKYGKRISLLCRISKEMGIEVYSDINPKLGFPMDNEDSIKVQDDITH